MLKIDFGSGYNPYPGYKTCDITQGPYLDFHILIITDTHCHMRKEQIVH